MPLLLHHRLAAIVTAGVAAIAGASAAALLLARGPAAPQPTPPSWNLFDDAQWASIGAQLSGFDAATLHVVAAMPPLAMVAARRDDGTTCFAVVRHTTVGAPICRLSRPLLAFTLGHGRRVEVVGLARRRVTTLVLTADGLRQGGALLPAGPASAFGYGFATAPVLEALDADGTVLETLYCASALRGVCGMSAHRRS
jgi:hypothetical protein